MWPPNVMSEAFLYSFGCILFTNTDILLFSTQMGPHSVWCNDSSTDMEALRLDFPDSFLPEAAEDDLHDTTPEVPIPCMAQLLEKEIKANEEMPMTACRCGLALFYCSAWRRLSSCTRSLQAQHIASSSSLSTIPPARPLCPLCLHIALQKAKSSCLGCKRQDAASGLRAWPCKGQAMMPCATTAGGQGRHA